MGTLKLNNSITNAVNKQIKENESNDIAETATEQAKVSKLAMDDDGFIEEFENLREENVSVYRRNDRTKRKVISATPQYYRTESGELKEIDGKLYDNGNEIVNGNNSFKVKFDKNAQNGKIFDLQKGDNALSLSISSFIKNRANSCGCSCAICADSQNTVKVQCNDGTEIEYIALNDRIKENILVKERADKYEYNFTMNIGNLTVKEGENNRLLLKDKTTGQTQFIIPAPFMFDAKGVYSNDVSYEIDVNGEELLFKVVADANYINDENRVLPVTIDPQILTAIDGVLEFSTNEYFDENDYIYDDILKVERTTQNQYVYSAYVYLRHNIPEYVSTNKYTLRLVSKKNAYGSFIANYTFEKDKPPFKEFTAEEGRIYTFDITEDIKQNTNIISFLMEPGSENSHIEFFTSGEYAPQLIITAVGETSDLLNEGKVDLSKGETEEGPGGNGDSGNSGSSGVQQKLVYPNLKELELSNKMKCYFDLNDGTLCTAVNDFASSEFVLPLNIVHVHKLGIDTSSYGINWRLNLNKKLTVAEDDNNNNTKFIFTDELGDKYVFEEKYYYDGGWSKVFIDKSQIKTDVNGNLTYNDIPIYKYNYCHGYTLIPEINDFINAEIIDQRQAEHAELEEFVKSYSVSLSYYVKFNMSSKNIIDGLRVNNAVELNELLKGALEGTNYIIVTKSEALQLKSLLIQIESIDKQIAIIGDDPKKKAELEQLKADKETYESQRDLLKEQAYDNIPLVKDAFLKYFRKKAELEQLVLQTPVNFIKDENGIINGFNKNGDLVLICDAYGNYVSVVYDHKGRISSLYDSDNKTMKFEYDAYRLTSITDNLGRTIKYEYANAELTKIIYPDGETLDIKYTAKKIRSIATNEGKHYQMSYSGDKFTRLLHRRTLPDTKTVSDLKITYSENQTQLEDSNGSREIYQFYDNKMLKQREKRDVRRFNDSTYYFYDGNTTTEKKYVAPDNNPVTEIYKKNELDLIVNKSTDWKQISDAVREKTETEYTYDLSNHVTQEKEIKSVETSGIVKTYTFITNYSYNAQGSLVLTESYCEEEKETHGKDYEQRVYDKNGNVTKTIRWNSLDSSSKFYTESDCAENGQVTADRDETGEISAEYEYVNGSNVVNSVKYANGSKLAYGRNPKNFRVTSVTQSTEDGEANTADITYQYGRPVKVKSGNTEIEYAYDHKDRKASVCVNGILQSEYSYEDYKELTPDDYQFEKRSKTVYLSGSDKVKSVYLKVGAIDEAENLFDATETLTVKSDKLYQKEYNVKNELVSLTYLDGGVNRTVNYVYDAYHKLMQAQTVTDGVIGLTEAYSYNEYNDVVAKILSGAVEQSYTYGYKNNSSRELEAVTFNGSYKFKPLTDVNGRNIGKEVYNGTTKTATESITYRKVGDRATNMPATVWFGDGAKIKDSLKYRYDKCGNITEVLENGHLIAKYSYDKLNRLIREDNKPLNKTTLYSYDQSGNITERCEYAYTSKNAEELSELNCTHASYDYDGDKLLSYNGESFAYNNMGNPTKYRGKQVEWQYGTRLVTLGNVTFAYDGLGRRTKKGSTKFTYDNEGNLVCQSDGLEFIYDKSGVAGLKYQGQVYFYRKDAQGNIIAILDSSGYVVVKYNYDAWGGHTVTGSNTALGNLNPFRYRGYYYDTETQLYYLQTRYYDPEVGRFISQDDVDYADPETINGINLYAYCANNPVMNVDPTGTSFWEWLVGGIIAVASFCFAVATMGIGVAVAATVSGALVGAAYGGITAAMTGQNIWEGIGLGILTGISLSNFSAAFGGLALAGKMPLGTAVVSNFGFSSLIGGGAEIFSQLLSNGKVVDWNKVLINTLEWGALNTINFGLGYITELGVVETLVGGYIYNVITGVAGFIIDLFKSDNFYKNSIR